MPAPSGFEWAARKNGDIVITHRGRPAVTLRGQRAEAFRTEIVENDPQDVMARATGNYRRGNERLAKRHQRNRR